MSSTWNSVHLLPPLEAGEVQLWRLDLAGASGLSDRYASLLSPVERLHASRCRAGQVRDHFTVGRACLRVLLGNTFEMDPRLATIIEGVHGKPETPDLGEGHVSFNVAHSKDTILIALVRKGLIGVDVEYFDRSTDIMEVAQHNFTAKESNALAAIADPHARLKTFYRYWTRKEAVLKADGQGLLAPLASFDISFESVQSHPVLISESSNDRSKLYFVSDLDLGIDAAAAFAVETPGCRISQLSFPLGHSW
jgi:4'-phosphopantetheinyl transferase